MDTFNEQKIWQDNLVDNVTRDALKVTGLNPNEKNTVIESLIIKNPLESLFNEKNDSTIGQMHNCIEKVRKVKDLQTEILPTAGELTQDGKLIMLFRTTPETIGAGNQYPFQKSGYIVGPLGVFQITSLREYGREPFNGSIDVSRPSSGGVARAPVSIDGEYRLLIEGFELNPSQNKGNLVNVYNEIARIL